MRLELWLEISQLPFAHFLFWALAIGTRGDGLELEDSVGRWTIGLVRFL